MGSRNPLPCIPLKCQWWISQDHILIVKSTLQFTAINTSGKFTPPPLFCGILDVRVFSCRLIPIVDWLALILFSSDLKPKWLVGETIPLVGAVCRRGFLLDMGGVGWFLLHFWWVLFFFFPDFGSERITIFRLQGLLCPEFCILSNIFRDRMFLPQIITPLVHYYLGMIVFFEFSWFSLSLHWLFEDLHVHTHTFFLYELPNSCTPFGAILLVQEALLELKLPEKRKNSGSDCRFPNIKSSFFLCVFYLIWVILHQTKDKELSCIAECSMNF